MYVLVKFSHGLGDAVQLTCVLQHLQKYRPESGPTPLPGIGTDSKRIRILGSPDAKPKSEIPIPK